MALSGSFSGSIISGKYTLRVDWSATQNVASNTSKITAAMYLVQAQGWGLDVASRSCSTTINGAAYAWTAPAINNSGGTTHLASVTSADIVHNADGTKSVTISATYNIRATINGTYYESITASATLALNTIPRATTPTFNTSSVAMGDTLTIYTARASSSFKHDLAYSFAGSSWETFATGVETWHAWAVPDLATSIPTAINGVMTIRCTTKNGSTVIGTTTATVTVNVPDYVVPTVQSVTYTDATEGIFEQFGAFISGKSKLNVSIQAEGAWGSWVKSYHGRLLDLPYTGQTFTTSVLTGSGELGISVKDSRGRWSERQAYQINVLDYSKPAIERLNVYRVDSNGNAVNNGNRVAVSYKYTAPSLNGGNTCSCVIQYKRTTASSWSTLLSTSGTSKDTTAYPTATLSPDYTYDIRLTVTDWFGADVPTTATLPTGKVIMDFKADGAGVAFGKACEKAGVEVASDWPVYLGDYNPDYVIDQGTSGIWKYTRWASGKVEAVGKVTVNTAVSSAWGSIYASGPLYGAAAQLPFTFKEKPYVTACLDGSLAGAWLIASGSSSGATKSSAGLYEICRGTSSTAKDYVIIFNVVGFI